MTPGSQAAIYLGCRCDPGANNGGLGDVIGHVNPMRGVQYVVASVCPMHGPLRWDSGYGSHIAPNGEQTTIPQTPITVWESKP